MENMFFKPHNIELNQQTYIVGDIHGFFDKLQKNIKDNNITDKDLLIVNGDFINKGKQTIEVYNYLSERPNTILLFGNHEYAFINVMIHIQVNKLHLKHKNRKDIAMYMQYRDGMGARWMDNYDFEDLFRLRTQLFNDCYSSLEINVPEIDKKMGVIHAAVCGYHWENIDQVDFNVWNFSHFNSISKGEHKEIKGIDYVVFGHAPIKEAGMSNNSIFIDTGSYNRYQNDLTFFNVNKFFE